MQSWHHLLPQVDPWVALQVVLQVALQVDPWVVLHVVLLVALQVNPWVVLQVALQILLLLSLETLIARCLMAEEEVR